MELARAIEDLQHIQEMEVSGMWYLGIDGLVQYELSEKPDGTITFFRPLRNASGKLVSKEGCLMGEEKSLSGKVTGHVRFQKCRGGLMRGYRRVHEHDFRSAFLLGSRDKGTAAQYYELRCKVDGWEWLESPGALPGEMVEIPSDDGTIEAEVERVLTEEGDADDPCILIIGRTDSRTLKPSVRVEHGKFTPKQHPLPWWAYCTEGVSTKEVLTLKSIIPTLRVQVFAILLVNAGSLAFTSMLMSRSGDAVYVWCAIALFVPVLSAKLLLECQCFRLFAVPYVIHMYRAGHYPFEVAPFTQCGKAGIYFVTVSGFLTSLLKSLDMITDSAFAGSVNGSPDREAMEQVWERSRQSSLSYVIRMDHAVLLLWVVSLGHIIWPFVLTLRGGFSSQSDDAEEAMLLMESAEFETIPKLNGKLAHAKIVSRMDRIDTNFLALEYSLAASKHFARRVCLRSVGEECMGLWVQASVLAIRGYLLSHTVLDEADRRLQQRIIYFQVASLFLGAVMTALALLDARHFFMSMGPVERHVSSGDQWEQWSEEHRHTYRIMQRCIWVVRVGCFLMVSSLIYTMLVTAGVAFCEDSIWLASRTFSGTYGCLDMGDVIATHVNS